MNEERDKKILLNFIHFFFRHLSACFDSFWQIVVCCTPFCILSALLWASVSLVVVFVFISYSAIINNTNVTMKCIYQCSCPVFLHTRMQCIAICGAASERLFTKLLQQNEQVFLIGFVYRQKRLAFSSHVANTELLMLFQAFLRSFCSLHF